jgi:hypothetical protein
MPRGRSKATLELIEASQEILAIEAPTTVRAICYRLFTRGLIKNMGRAETNKVSRVLTEARERGEIRWSDVVDETRGVEQVYTWDSPDQIIDSAVRGYRRDYWQAQDHWVEVWSEKGTIRGVLKPVLDKYGVAFRVMHGFASATVVNDIAEDTQRSPKLLTVLYVGDWDPSGMYMSEADLPGRLAQYGAESFEIHRTALTLDDVSDGGLPSFGVETKQGDKRYRWFSDNFGHRCWELDALPSNILRDRVEKQIRALIDEDNWKHMLAIEAEEVASMQKFHRMWQKAQARKARISGLASKYPEAWR